MRNSLVVQRCAKWYIDKSREHWRPQFLPDPMQPGLQTAKQSMRPHRQLRHVSKRHLLSSRLHQLHPVHQWHFCKLPRLHSLQIMRLLQRRILPCQLWAHHWQLHAMPSWLLLKSRRHHLYGLPTRNILNCNWSHLKHRLHSMRYRDILQHSIIQLHPLPCRLHHSKHKHVIALRLQHVYSRHILRHRCVCQLQRRHVCPWPQCKPVHKLLVRMVFRRRGEHLSGLPCRLIFCI